MDQKKIIIQLENQEIILETHKIAKQANGSVFLHVGDTSVLATACFTEQTNEETDFLPLRVDYQEKFSSAGKTLGGFIKREGRPTAHEILTSRFIDRSLRPLFEEGFFNEIQVLSYVFSYDGINTPDVLAICAASAALILSDIPFTKPIGAVRVGKIENKLIINPSKEQQKKSTLDLVLAGTENAIIMIEGFCDFLTEDEVLEAIDYGHNGIKQICQALSQWQKQIGKKKNFDVLYKMPKEIYADIKKIIAPQITEALTISDKKKREKLFSAMQTNLEEELCSEEKEKYTKRDVKIAFKTLSSQMMRENILQQNKRIDGRKFNEIRPISIEANLLGRTHGSCLFTRGETQALAVCTLGGETMAQRYETIHEEGAERFYLQYFFPSYSVGEVGRSGPPGRREIGHGKLAERALAMTLPDQVSFPYVIRLESNITESNGSSSMASVCGGCIALMDAGVPIKKPVSGIAMGLILEKEQFIILSDILGVEDALGDMDFKVTGDDKGITAFQMDIKIEGITLHIMKEALQQAKEGRIHILNKMTQIYPKPREKLSKYVPKIEIIQIRPSQIGTLIGPGGKQIRSIIDETKVDIDISDEGLVQIISSDQEAIDKAKEMIHALVDEVEVNKIYKGKITSIRPFGLFIELSGGKEGLCHISEISHSRITNLEKIFKEGDLLEVKVVDINERGQIRLSHKVLLEK